MIDNILMWKYAINNPYVSGPIALSDIKLPTHRQDIIRLRKVFMQMLIQNSEIYFDSRIEGIIGMTLVDLMSLEVPEPLSYEEKTSSNLISLTKKELQKIIQTFQEYTQECIKDTRDRSG